MYKSGKPITLWSAAFMGIGTMVGAGIFALLGQAGAIAYSAVYISFILSGIIALLTAYSVGRLGARFPAAGGLVEYLVQGYGNNLFSGAVSIMLYFNYLIGLALIAKTFGAYAAVFLPEDSSQVWVTIFALLILFVLGLLNYSGSKNTARFESILVVTKIFILLIFGVIGLMVVNPDLLSTSQYPPFNSVLFSIAITFFAYTGFSVITNVAEDMPNPKKNIPRALFIAISLVMLLYVLIAFAVFGNLSPAEVVKAKDYALAESAKPIFGSVGFIIISIAALISTSSSINASLYAVTNVTYQLAKDGELPSDFGKPFGHSKEGLKISLILIGVLTIFLNLTQIAAAGSVGVLIVYVIIHLGHLKIIKKTGASYGLVTLALISNVIAVVLALAYFRKNNLDIIFLVLGMILLSFTLEYLLRVVKGREIVKRYRQSIEKRGFQIKKN